MWRDQKAEELPGDRREDEAARRACQLLVGFVDLVDDGDGRSVVGGSVKHELAILQMEHSVTAIHPLGNPGHQVVRRIEPLDETPQGLQDRQAGKPVEEAVYGAEAPYGHAEDPCAQSFPGGTRSSQVPDQGTNGLIREASVLDVELESTWRRVRGSVVEELHVARKGEAASGIHPLAEELKGRCQHVAVAAPVLPEECAQLRKGAVLLLAPEQQLGRAERARGHDHETARDVSRMEAAFSDPIEIDSIAPAVRRDRPDQMKWPHLRATLLRDEQIVLVQGVPGAHVTSEIAVAQLGTGALPGAVAVSPPLRHGGVRTL